MSTTIQLKKSGTPGNVPLSTGLSFGELAINYADGVLYYKNANGTVSAISGAGGGANGFTTIDANGTILISDSNTDILSFVAGNAFDITANAILDTVTFNVRTTNDYLSNSVNEVATANVINLVYGIATSAYQAANAANAAAANASMTIREIYTSNANVVNSFSGINTIQFDADSDFAVVDESNNTVTIKMNSTFKYWRMNGAPALEAVGQDTVNFLTDGNVTVEANNANTPYKTISFAIPEFANVSSQANSSSHTVDVAANSGSQLFAKKLNFVNTSTVLVSVTDNLDGNANIALTASVSGLASSFTSDLYVANGAQTVYSIAQSTSDQDSVFVFLDGVSQVPTIDYAVSGNTITFLAPPENQSVIEIRTISAAASVLTPTLIANGFSVLQLSNSASNFSVGGFSITDDAISRTYLLRGITTNANESELYINGSNRIPVKQNTTVFYTADIVGRRTDAIDECSGIQLKGVVDNFNGTVDDVGNIYELIVAKDSANVAVDMRADDTNNSVNIYVTGEAGKTIRWVALVKTVEVSQ